jgi:hypothetical protein
VSALDRSAEAVTARLRQVAALADLRVERRLACKLDYSPEAVTRRLRQVSELRRLCLGLRPRAAP